MRKTVERAVVLSNIRDEAGRVMRSFLDGKILRNSLSGAINSLFMLEIQFSDIIKEKHELGEINYVIKTQIENGENLYSSLKYVRSIFLETNVFGELH
ncbi:hypothetical protein GC101_28415 [Paenibacillus sp. LMG 31459]|uniref:Uncharacterized protein n=1 Tax=Paenibacillus phytohabitans TaxID=2654978 RepID=A0ABX1YSJ7_9BACL|nr:hypothetical protein [Paenibacillus phytohabitans]NOU82793.1 hypothetical protein [Paenibacillus phytohabitans]